MGSVIRHTGASPASSPDRDSNEPCPLKQDRPTWNAKAAKPAKHQIQPILLCELCALCVRRRREMRDVVASAVVPERRMGAAAGRRRRDSLLLGDRAELFHPGEL